MSEVSTETNQQNQKQFALGMDIGGQGVRADLFELKDGKIVGNPIDIRPESMKNEKGKVEPKKGRVAFTQQIAEVIETGYDLVSDEGHKLTAIGIGMPGRFDPKGTIKTGSASNLDDPTLPKGKGMDGFQPQLAIAAALKAKNIEADLVVRNDGDAMLTGILKQLKQPLDEQRAYESDKKEKGEAFAKTDDGHEMKPGELTGQTALFGLGTGLGHAIVEDPLADALKFVTDGHASKLAIKVDAEDVSALMRADRFLEDHKKVSNRIAYKTNEQGEIIAQAEHLFNDPTVKALAGVLDGKHMKADENEEHRKALEFAGKYVARTIAAIASGKNSDMQRENEWSEKDRYNASKTRNYIFAGGLGSSDDGQRIIKFAREELDRLADKAESAGTLCPKTTENQPDRPLAHHLRNIELIQYRGPEVACHAAATMALEQSRGRSRSA